MLRSRVMSKFFAIVAGSAVVLLAASSWAEDAPYEARVVATGAPVLSGPGEKFYPTDTLAQGDVVEVYREKPGGWLAIRPPAGSFSWVLESDLKKQDGDLAEIAKEQVASRIGSRLSDQHNAAQVRLAKGEIVEVLDEETLGDERWCKIAPPAGEFRWIQSSLVERNGVMQTAAAEIQGEATAPPLMSGTTAAEEQPAPATASAPSTEAAAPAPAAQPAPVAPVAVKPQSVGPVGDDLARQLSDIELRLSRMVAAPVNLWNTQRLERDAAQLLGRAQNAADRDAVQTTMNKIHQFALIGQKSGQVPSAFVQGGQAGAVPAPGAVAAAPGATMVNGIAPAGATGQYDAVGVLRPVVSKRPGAPQFALVDERGQVLSFVSSSPDVNLQPYLGRRVGVVGNRGYIAEFNKSHVTAARVTPIAEGLRR